MQEEGGEHMHLLYAESTVHGCSASTVLSWTEGKVRLCIR